MLKLTLISAVISIIAVTTLTHAEDIGLEFQGLGTTIQRLQFHTGQVVAGKSEISPTLPDIPGPPSPWTVTQWGQGDSILTADHMRVNDISTRDPRLGVAKYSFDAPDGHSHVWIYQRQSSEPVVYELYERDGPLRDSGGANIFLSINTPIGSSDLSHGFTLGLDEKLSKASISASTLAQKSGVVAASVFIGMVIHFPEPITGKQSTIFIQIPLAGTRLAATAEDYRTCKTGDGRRILNLFEGLRQSQPYYEPFASDSGPLRHLNININEYIKAAIQKPINCLGDVNKNEAWSLPNSASQFIGWTLSTLYIGLETENHDVRKNAKNTSAQGSVNVAMQISNLKILQDLK